MSQPAQTSTLPTRVKSLQGRFCSLPLEIQLEILGHMVKHGGIDKAYALANACKLGTHFQHTYLVGPKVSDVVAIVRCRAVEAMDIVHKLHGDRGVGNVLQAALERGETAFASKILDFVPGSFAFAVAGTSEARLMRSIKFAAKHGIAVRCNDGDFAFLLCSLDPQFLDVVKKHVLGDAFVEAVIDNWNHICELLTKDPASFLVLEWWARSAEFMLPLGTDVFDYWWGARCYGQLRIALELGIVEFDAAKYRRIAKRWSGCEVVKGMVMERVAGEATGV